MIRTRGAGDGQGLADRLEASGIFTIAQLLDRINGVGRRWAESIKGIGAANAARVKQWLGEKRETIGIAVARHVAVPRTALYRHELQQVVRAAADVRPLDALAPDLRSRMGVAEPTGLQPLQAGEGLDGPEWAQHEFGGAELGDQRLNERLVDSARALGAYPGLAFCGVARGDIAAVKGYYRLIDKPDDGAATPQAMLAPHRLRTLQRMKAQRTVLSIQDGTDLNYPTLVQCEGLGSIGTK